MNNYGRRTFLKSLGLGASAFLLSSRLAPRIARADDTDRSFVFCYFRGGWDCLLGLDPRDPGTFTDARAGETRIQLGWDQIPATYGREIIQPRGSNIPLGPVMGGIAPHFDKMCVVNGLSMDTVAHEVGRMYFITGMAPRGTQPAGSSLPTRIVAQQGDRSALPNLVVRVDTYNEGLPTYASGLAVGNVGDLVSTLTDGSRAPTGVVREKLDAYRARAAACDPTALDRRGLLGLIESSQVKARSLVDEGLSAKFNFTSTTDPEMVELATRYGITVLASPQAQAAMAFQALRYGMAQCVTIELADDLDTHDQRWATDHPDQLFAGFSALGRLLEDLAATDDPARGGKLLDHTTLLAFSEFGRTSMINARDGRDHSLTSSCLLAGAGVPHNRVIGRSSDVNMVPVAVDPTTGEARDGGTFLTPNLVAASIMQSAGFNTDALRTQGLPCLMA